MTYIMQAIMIISLVVLVTSATYMDATLANNAIAASAAILQQQQQAVGSGAILPQQQAVNPSRICSNCNNAKKLTKIDNTLNHLAQALTGPASLASFGQTQSYDQFNPSSWSTWGAQDGAAIWSQSRYPWSQRDVNGWSNWNQFSKGAWGLAPSSNWDDWCSATFNNEWADDWSGLSVGQFQQPSWVDQSRLLAWNSWNRIVNSNVMHPISPSQSAFPESFPGSGAYSPAIAGNAAGLSITSQQQALLNGQQWNGQQWTPVQGNLMPSGVNGQTWGSADQAWSSGIDPALTPISGQSWNSANAPAWADQSWNSPSAQAWNDNGQAWSGNHQTWNSGNGQGWNGNDQTWGSDNGQAWNSNGQTWNAGSGQAWSSNGQTFPANGNGQAWNGQTWSGNGNGQTWNGNDNGQNWNGNDQTWNGNGQTWNGNDQTWNGNGQTWNGNGQTWNGNSQNWNGNGQNWNGNGQTWNGNDQTWNGNSQNWNGNGQTWNGNSQTWNGQGWNGNDQGWNGQGGVGAASVSQCAELTPIGTMTNATLQCPAGQVIQSVTQAAWGQSAGTCQAPAGVIGQCTSDVATTVARMCLNQNTCSFGATTVVLGTPIGANGQQCQSANQVGLAAQQTGANSIVTRYTCGVGVATLPSNTPLTFRPNSATTCSIGAIAAALTCLAAVLVA